MGEGFTLLPPKPDVCQECAVDHDPLLPHNAQSLYYQYSFYAEHGRWPTWKDALAHCEPEMQQFWEEALREKGAWTEPESEVPDVCPTEDGTIGTIQMIPIEEDDDA